MKFSTALYSLLSFSLLLNSMANATATHTAEVAVELIQIDEKGKEHSLESSDGKFFLDWSSKKCEVQFKKQKFAYCNLDTSQDITNSKGELVMKSLPQAHFDQKVLDALIRTLGLEDRNTKKIISKVVDDSSAKRVKGFDLPFYSCGDCEKNGKELMLWNAYQGSVARDLLIEHSWLGGKKLVLRMKIKDMKAVKGAFNIIGNSNASDYGH